MNERGGLNPVVQHLVFHCRQHPLDLGGILSWLSLWSSLKVRWHHLHRHTNAGTTEDIDGMAVCHCRGTNVQETLNAAGQTRVPYVKILSDQSGVCSVLTPPFSTRPRWCRVLLSVPLLLLLSNRISFHHSILSSHNHHFPNITAARPHLSFLSPFLCSLSVSLLHLLRQSIRGQLTDFHFRQRWAIQGKVLKRLQSFYCAFSCSLLRSVFPLDTGV